jgi:hypothetical protein
MPDNQIALASLLPPGWDTTSAGARYWIRCFRMSFVDAKVLPQQGWSTWELAGAAIVLFHGAPRYLSVTTSTLQEGTDMPTFKVESAGEVQAPVGEHLVLVTPFRDDEPQVRDRLDELAASIKMDLGRNAVATLVYDNVLTPATGQTSVSTAPFENAAWWGEPDLSPRSLHRVADTDLAIEAAGPDLAQRIRLAQRWYEKSFSPQHVDAFLAAWIALEVLAMPNTTNIRQLQELTAAAYSMTRSEAEREFGLGTIFGLRSRIVHGGERPPIHAQLIRFLQALTCDLIHQLTGTEVKGDARSVFQNPDIAVGDWHPGRRG